MTDPALTVEVAATGLLQPTSLAFIGDGDALVTEKSTGLVRRIQGGQLAPDPVIDLAVNNFDERGLLGIAVHPDFGEQPFVYLYWTARNESEDFAEMLGEDSDQAKEVPELGNRVDRFRWDGSALAWDRNIIKMRSNTLETDTTGRIRGNHDAGPISFGADGKLYTVNGDQNLRGQLQNVADGPEPDNGDFAGIVVRLNDDGSTPEDNPFFAAGAEIGGQVGENIQEIWAYGVRNSFGLAHHPTTGDLWQTENGDDSWDEINIFPAGANSGWIQVIGPPERYDEYRSIETGSTDGLDNPDFPPDRLAPTAQEAQDRMFALEGARYTPPVFSWKNPVAVTAVGFVTGDALGAGGDGVVVGTVLSDVLLRYPLSEDGRSLALTGGLEDKVDDNAGKGDLGESADSVWGRGFGIVTDLDAAADGSMWVVSLSAGQVYRIRALAPGETPPPAPSGQPGASGSPAASASPGASPSAGTGGPVAITIGTDPGTELKFVPTEASATTGAEVSLTFQNQSTVPHNLTFGPPINKGTKPIVNAGESETLTFAAPEAGDHKFVCTLHPGMEGVLRVTP